MGKTFKTSRGIEIECLPIPTLVEKLQARHPMPEPPTYTVDTITGVQEVHPYDEATVAALGTEEATAAWAEYQQKLKAATSAYNQALMRLVMLRGIKFELPATDEWIQEQKWIGLAVPDDPRERKLHWLETEALATLEDYTELLNGVMEASGIPQEVLDQAEATFRREVAGTDETAGPGAPAIEPALDHQLAV